MQQLKNRSKLLVVLIAWLCVLPAAGGPPVGNQPVKMVFVKAGSYIPLYGELAQKVKVAGFLADETAVTNRQFLAFVKKYPQYQRSKIKPLFADKAYLRHWNSDTGFDKRYGNAPVTHVSWFVARRYCSSLGKRLPTTDEWEYLASYGKTKQYPEGLAEKILEWYSRPASEVSRPVKSSDRNVLGLYDLHGLVWEWVEDFNTALVTGESRGDSELDRNLFCGAGAQGAQDFKNYAAFMRFAFRSSLEANYTMANLSFRCVK